MSTQLGTYHRGLPDSPHGEDADRPELKVSHVVDLRAASAT